MKNLLEMIFASIFALFANSTSIAMAVVSAYCINRAHPKIAVLALILSVLSMHSVSFGNNGE